FANWSVEQTVTRPELILCLLVFALTFPGRNRYRENFFDASVDIVISWLTLLGLLMFCGSATRSFEYFDELALVSWAVATPLVQIATVWVGRQLLLRHASQPESRRAAIVIGGGALGVKVARALHGIDNRGSDFLGYFDDRSDARLHESAATNRLGGLNDVATFVREKGVREVFITLPLGSQPRIVELLERLQGTTASLFFVPDVFGISIIQGRLQDMNGVPVVGICETPFTGTNELIKRISDVVLSSIILILTSPLLLVLAIGVKLSSPGPVIFKQRRNGLEGEEIIVYKFRSMTTQDNGPVVRQATRNDARLTPFGAFMRRTSLDELPQFINVLQGRMSIVGPRPHAVAHNEQYRNLIKAYMVRHKVRPGLTGWAQINGLRGETDTIEKMQMRVEYDLEYLRNWSITLDLQIILRTMRVAFIERTAY
ncbi:MAG: undecaprenyl-phosphate glucose phosphotransferase, partial [Hydrogenophaga sp.]|nr:undecaprenyl-phosphate glucose phosphotransferase [Hydrogenophaga sp.]